jgi:DNA-binding NarL/FixJ family response regulator
VCFALGVEVVVQEKRFSAVAAGSAHRTQHLVHSEKYLLSGISLRRFKIQISTFLSRMRPIKTNLTQREVEVLSLIAQGMSSVRIAQKLDISFETVKVHRRNMLRKVEAHNTFELIRLAIKQRWI